MDKGDPVQATKLLSASGDGVFSLCFAPRWMLLPPKMQRYETKEMIRLHRCTSPWPHRQAAQSPGAAMESSKLMDAVQFALNSEAPEPLNPNLCTVQKTVPSGDARQSGAGRGQDRDSVIESGRALSRGFAGV